MNYAEQLTYWYLRLNGFFPLTNFVPHRDSAEIDMVALRLPHVAEDIGGNPNDWDPRFRDSWGICLGSERIGLFVEVKSGAWDAADLVRAGVEWRLCKGIKRMGMVRPEIAERVASDLSEQRVVRRARYTFAKLFVGRDAREPPHWLYLRLDDADAFIRERMARYPDKNRDRTRFGGALIQYLAWQGGDAGPD